MLTRQLSVSTSFDYALPITMQLPLIADARFTHVSLGENADHSGYLDTQRRRHLAELLREHGLQLDTIHGPRVDQHGNDVLPITVAAAAELGAPIVVAHAGPFDFPTAELLARLDIVRRQCQVLAPLLEQTGVVLALENVVPGPATQLVRMALEDLDPRFFGLCFDSAHDQIGGPRPFELLATLGHRLHAVHLSDRVRAFVDHVPPGDGFIDWPTLSTAIRATPFAAPLLFEVMITHTVEKEASQLLRRTYVRGSRLYDQIFAGRGFAPSHRPHGAEISLGEDPSG
jgi:sugar phosphate isomerase/epimerase